jgi:hypothetical protein
MLIKIISVLKKSINFVHVEVDYPKKTCGTRTTKSQSQHVVSN